jgi:hypothetical protein
MSDGEMKEYRVKWCQCPHVQHTPGVMFIQAASPDDAKKIARDHIERTRGIEWLSIQEVTEAPPVPRGTVIQR